MYKLITLLIVVFLFGCSDNSPRSSEHNDVINDGTLKEEINKMYSYRAIMDEDKELGSSKFLDIGIMDGEESAKFRGSLLTLFGEPSYKSDNAEAAYSYLIEVSDETSKWYFTVYEGSSGPAIGYGYDEKENQANAREAAQSLLDKITETTPSDFTEVVYYEDFGTKITYGCKGGQCFYKEENEGTF